MSNSVTPIDAAIEQALNSGSVVLQHNLQMVKRGLADIRYSVNFITA